MFLLYMARMAENNYKNVPVSVIFTPKKCHCMNLKEDNCLFERDSMDPKLGRMFVPQNNPL